MTYIPLSSGRVRVGLYTTDPRLPEPVVEVDAELPLPEVTFTTPSSSRIVGVAVGDVLVHFDDGGPWTARDLGASDDGGQTGQ